MKIENNTLRYNGYLNEEIFSNHTDSTKQYYADKIEFSFPMDPYLF